MGKTKPERSPGSVAKATKRIAKKLVCIIFFDAFFLKQVLKLGTNIYNSIWGRQNQKEAPKVLQKLPHAWQKKLVCIIFSLTRFF